MPNIQNILSKGEGLRTEFKEAKAKLPKNLFETVCAFLNREGGTILLGVNDQNKVTGVDEKQVDKLCTEFAALSNNPNHLDPVFLLHPKVLDFEGKKLIHVFVPASSQVHKTASVVYDRSDEGDFALKTDAQISNLYQRKSTFYSEATIYPYLDETAFQTESIEKALRLIRNNRPDHPWLHLAREDFYKAAGLFRHDLRTGEKGFTLAALLLFGTEEAILSAIPYYKTDALLRRVDTDRYDDRENVRCNLIEAYEQLMNFVAKHLPDKFYMAGGLRVSLREKIFREIVANTLVHREYTNAHPATLIIYTDRVEVKNANKPHLNGNLRPGSFDPYPKNPVIAKFFVQLARAEDLGTGINNVFHYLKAYNGSEPEFMEEDLFTVKIPLQKEILYSNENTEKQDDISDDTLNDTISDTLNDRINDTIKGKKRQVLKYITMHPGIKASDLTVKLNISTATINRYLKTLKEAQTIEHRGSKKTGGYYPKNQH